MCRGHRCSQLHEAPVESIPLVAGLHGVVAVPRSRINATNMHPRRDFPTATAFLGNDNNVSLQFSTLLRSPINHFLPEDFSPGPSRVPEDFVVSGFAEDLQVSGDIL